MFKEPHDLRRRSVATLFVCLAAVMIIAMPARAASGETKAQAEGHEVAFAKAFVFIAVLVLCARVGGSIAKRFGQPPVLGELLVGVLIGNLGLVGFRGLEGFVTNELVAFVSAIGAVLLLFLSGLESNIADMKKVGIRALLVAFVGVAVPFALGTYLVGPRVMPGLNLHDYLFLGATLTATSVGITARVFKDLNYMQARDARIVLGAAVADDVIGLIILAVVSSIVSVGTVTLLQVAGISAKAVFFLVGSIVAGSFAAPHLSRFFAKIQEEREMKIALALGFCAVFAYAASLVGLAMIVGGFAAGLVLDPIRHFSNFARAAAVRRLRTVLERSGEDHIRHEIGDIIHEHDEKHVEEDVSLFSNWVIPLFFAFTGFQVKLAVFFSPQILSVAFWIVLAAFAGKIVSGLVAGPGVNKWVVGIGMIPRGEVGLIFAAQGRALGVVNDSVFAVIVIMVMVSTLLTPPVLARIIRSQQEREAGGGAPAPTAIPS